MFKTLDLLVGFTVVMLVISMAVTLITQIIVGWLNLRGRALKTGITELLVLIDSGITRVSADQIADHVLRDPLVGQSKLFGGRHLAAVVQREELTKLLLGFGLDPETNLQSPRKPGATQQGVAALQRTMRESLQKNGISNPDATLERIRMASLKLEESHPELSNSMRVNTAILKQASSNFVGKLNGWFDQTVDRASDVFTRQTHLVAVGVAVVIALTLQLDSLKMINTLSANDEVRNQVVKWAVQHPDKLSPDTAKPADDLTRLANETIFSSELVRTPTDWREWAKNWLNLSTDMGVALSAMLLSLGAPFWYGALKNLLKLRSAIASTDDTQRQERQTTQTATA